MRVLIKKTNEILEVDGAQLKGVQIRLRRGIYTYYTIYDCEENAQYAFDTLLQEGYIIVNTLHDKE